MNKFSSIRDEEEYIVTYAMIGSAAAKRKKELDAAHDQAKAGYREIILSCISKADPIVCFVKEGTKVQKTSLGETSPTMFVNINWFRDIIKELRDSGLTIEDSSNTDGVVAYRISL